jgi:hypothetical protein
VHAYQRLETNRTSPENEDMEQVQGRSLLAALAFVAPWNGTLSPE